MSEQVLAIGRIVHYRLSVDDADAINRRRTSGQSIAERMLARPRVWHTGAQAHIGNFASVGDVFPMMITKTWGDDPRNAVNGQVFLDGNDVLWATSVHVGDGPRTFSWPVKG